MKAIRIHQYGSSDQLKVEEIETPTLKSNQVLVNVHNVGVNPVDWKIREGLRKDKFPVDFPATVGQDFAGEIERIGIGVTDFKVGDAVYGFASGAYAEYVAASVEEIALAPHTLDFIEMASIPTAGLTAWQGLIDYAKLESGQRILIHGAGGGVGSIACQIAIWKDAHVIGTCSPDDREYLYGLGVDELLDYKKDNFEEMLEDIDVVLDLIGGETQKKSLNVLKPGGIIVTTVGGLDVKKLEGMGLRGTAMTMTRDGRGLAQIAKLVDEGHINPRISCVLDLEDAARAQDFLQDGHPHGKVILEVDHAAEYENSF
jgi:NADPH:quinone reductase-like Zn-dependent oxidoreductase